MELLLLGPVELQAAGRSVPLGGARQRGVMAALAVDAGRPVPVDTLIDRVWGHAPPARARHALQAYIARIRGVFRAHAEGTVVAQVTRRSGGYLLDVDPARVDTNRFRSLVDRAREADRPDRQRVSLLRQALDLWRGPPLAGLPGDWAARVCQAWQRQHLDAVLAWADACLRLNEPEPVVAALTDLAGEQPMAESLAAGLIRALCASGRPAEGLDHYERVRRLLAEELGADPGPELRRLHRRILTGDPALCRPEGPARAPVPRLLPAPPQMFSGRRRELADLECAPDAYTVVITAIDGMAGVGKTALALHAAHHLAERFPDGQLFIDLHGYTQGLKPVEPGDALDRMLRTLGVPGEQIPADLDERAALYRSRLAGKRMLILLDNAATEAQAAPLIPGTPGCLAMITSRQHLAGLDRTHTLHLDTLPLADAVTLFARAVGDARVAAVPPAPLEEIVTLCGRLPLAVRIAAARLRSHPAWTVTHLRERLRDHQYRLAELAAGERSVTTTLDLSCQQLAADVKHVYGCLGLHPGSDIDPYAVAALAGLGLSRARRLIEPLLDAHLLQEPTAGRYAFHDLVRAHAVHTAAASTGPDRRAALTRLLDYFRHAASVAMDAAYPYERERRPRVSALGGVLPDLRGSDRATAWLDTELPNLLAVTHLAARDGWPDHAWQLSAILHRHLRTRGRYRDADTLHRQALTTARATGNRDGELQALIEIGDIRLMQGRYEEAVDHHGRALEIARTGGNRAGNCTRCSAWARAASCRARTSRPSSTTAGR
jgi:DNA-binding SARP family transcriptional activator/tetratricopeptide (TPR) repeat protein